MSKSKTSFRIQLRTQARQPSAAYFDFLFGRVGAYAYFSNILDFRGKAAHEADSRGHGES